MPSDMRINNLLLVLAELRKAVALSRSDLARITHLGVPTVHRLIGDLLSSGLVEEIAAKADHTQKGRPAVLYQLRPDTALLVGVDFGNQTARFALATSTGQILSTRSRPAARLARHPDTAVADEILSLLASAGVPLEHLAGIGAGVAAVVDPTTGVLRNPPRHRHLQGLNLGELLERKLGCPAIVRQDNHFAAVAEASQTGTFPGAESLVVVEIGTGIGAAMILNGTTIMGASGKFGRIAGWPVVTARRGVARSTLGESLVAGGLVEDYVRRGGKGQLHDGRALFTAAAEGDVVADAVVAWAGREIAELVIRLQCLCDPAAIVLGGGLAGSFAILEPHLRPHLPAGIHLAPSRLGEMTVLTGAVLSAMPFTESFVLQLLNETSFGSRAVREQSSRKASA